MKNPFAADEASGTISMLLGLIVLVFVALGVSLLAEGGLKLPDFSASSARLRDENDTLRRRINDLDVMIYKRTHSQKEAEENRRKAKLLASMKEQLGVAHAETEILRSLVKENKEAIELLTRGREQHRLRYRDHVRASAAGETYGKITTRLGEEFTDVKINEVTPLGVSITHSTGASRLGFREMPDAWRKKFMFTASEVAAAVAEEQKSQRRTRTEIARREHVSRKIRQGHAQQKKIAVLRSRIASLAMKHASASLEARLAQSKVATRNSLRRSRPYARSNYRYRYYNSRTGTYYTRYYRPRYRITVNTRKSVPGSLETWEARAMRYQRAATRYAAQLAALRAQLAAIDPSFAPTPAP